MDRIRKVYGSTTHDLIGRHAPRKGGRGRRLDDAGSGATCKAAGVEGIIRRYWHQSFLQVGAVGGQQLH